MAVLDNIGYRALTEESACEYVKSLKLFLPDEKMTVEEIGDGNLNYVYRITSNHKSVIIKQALPYAKVVGESWPLTLKRAKLEAEVLKKHGEFVPHLLPAVLASDEELALTVMEDLSHLTIVRDGLIQGDHYPNLSAHIGEYLAKTLFSTSDFALHPFEKKKLVAKFSNPELCKITEDLVFTDPFFDVETNDFEAELAEVVQQLWTNDKLKLEVAKIKYAFLTEAESLLHGDLHTGSIFASKSETKVIDPEFGFYGPIGFDVGQYIAHLIFQVLVRNENDRIVILQQIEEVWDVFSQYFSEAWQNSVVNPFTKVPGALESFLAKVFKDAIGVVGCELIRRTIGLSHVKDLDGIEDSSIRLYVKKATIQLGSSLIINRKNIVTISQLLKELEAYTS
ncbi:S-methyl-5-thioribose kinase [Cytobacillus sp. FSL W7-1323]|uniref:Methylthioribose kinase n=1 Tax=Cytobacillus kochii TaxID=859143 RepID=A0A248TEL4_9BACI|nr:S-methyl-5-thioribose kinase [Cytobacillus kochii]ASV66627.1 S-methyl-5-thioribose kinase [Cytobacillus kochii]